MFDEISIDEMMRQLQGGDEQAASELFARFVQRLIALARVRLDRRVQTIEPPDGVADSVLKSFIRRNADGNFEDLESWEHLWALLATIAVRKCINLNKKWLGPTRKLDNEKPWPLTDESQESHAMWEPIAHGATQSQAAMLVETLDELMRGLDERDRTILSLRLQGCTHEEISVDLDTSETTVKRRLRVIKNRMRRMQE